MALRLREVFTADPAVVRQELWNVLAQREYESVSLSEWSWRATRGSAGRNVLLGGFAQRMDFRFDIFADPATGTILDGGVSDETSSLLMGGAIGAKKTGDELAAVFAEVSARLTSS